METYNQSQVVSLEVLKRREKGRRFRERHREEINEQQRKRRQEKRDEKKRLDIQKQETIKPQCNTLIVAF